METNCRHKVCADVHANGTPIMVLCGTSWAGEIKLCTPCTKKYLKQYPQGWKYYPGDTCRHGVYVGGIGADYMCSYCESGEEPEKDSHGFEGYMPEDDGYVEDDRSEFHDPGGRSALRAGDRTEPCPTCGGKNKLTKKDVELGYACDACADALEGNPHNPWEY